MKTKDIVIGARYSCKVKGRNAVVRVREVDTTGYKHHSTARIVCKQEPCGNTVVFRSPSRLLTRLADLTVSKPVYTGWPCYIPFRQDVFRRITLVKGVGEKIAHIRVNAAGVTIRTWKTSKTGSNITGVQEVTHPCVTWSDIYALAQRRMRRGK